MKFYAGIGSRKTPKEILELMARIAIKLESLGWVLRSGGAGGADSAFGDAVKNKIIYIPWDGFDNGTNKIYSGKGVVVGSSDQARQMASELHPAWDRCSAGAQKLHSRNIYQVLGEEINPSSYSRFIICWTPNGEAVGGTATAIKLAEQNGIEVFNLADDATITRLKKLIGE